MTTKAQAQAALLAIADAIVEAVGAAPAGIPGGHLYAMLMPFGCNLAAFEGIMAALVKTGKLYKVGHVYMVQQ